MKKYCFMILAIAGLHAQAQMVQMPDQLWNPLFEDVQLKKIFPDNKTFVDVVPKATLDAILKNTRLKNWKETLI